MTDKPDVAALVEWLQTWSPVTENGTRAHLAASELTRLAAERDHYLSNWQEARQYLAIETHHAETAEKQRDDAKAEIARLEAEQWKRAVNMTKELNALNTEIARLVHLLEGGDYEDAALKPNTGEKP